LFTDNPFNMSMRVRVYDDLGELVAASQTSDAFPSPFNVSYVPYGSAEVRWTIAGFNSYSDLNGAYYRSYGIAGIPDYLGGWAVELDTVNWYRPHEFYPPVDGLLLGESFHTIGALGTGFVGNEYFFNHLGPWQQRSAVQIEDAHMSGEASIETSLSLRGLVRGAIVGATFAGDARTISWAQINFTSPTGNETQYSYDGFFEAYLNPGNYHLTVTEWTSRQEGHVTLSSALSVAQGSRAEGMDFFLERSGIPIPETINPALFVAFAFGLLVITFWLESPANVRVERDKDGDEGVGHWNAKKSQGTR